MTSTNGTIGTLLPGITLTLLVTAGAFVLGALLGLPLMFAKRSRHRLLRLAATLLIDFVRSIPELVWVFIIFYGLAEVGPKFGSVLSAILALGIFSSAYMAEIYRSGLLAVARGQWEAGASLGLRRDHLFVRIIAPQAALVAMPSALTYLLGLLKDSSLASVIGVTEIAFRANTVATNTDNGLTIYVWAACIYLGMSLVAAGLIKWVETRVRRVMSA